MRKRSFDVYIAFNTAESYTLTHAHAHHRVVTGWAFGLLNASARGGQAFGYLSIANGNTM